jgi:hypothetical protein
MVPIGSILCLGGRATIVNYPFRGVIYHLSSYQLSGLAAPIGPLGLHVLELPLTSLWLMEGGKKMGELSEHTIS